MKRLMMMLAAAAVTAAPGATAEAQPIRPEAAQRTQARPASAEHRIATEPARLEMGWLRPNEKGDGVVRVVNTSDSVVNLLRVTSSCTCTVGELTDDQKILRPGESTELEVSLKAGSNTGPMAQRAYIWYEGARAPYELFVVADVSLPVKTDPTFVNLLSPDRTGRIRLESLDGRPFRVTGVDGKTPTVYDLAGAQVDAKTEGTAFFVEYDFEGIAPEDLDRWFVIETDHPEARSLPLRVLHPSLYQTDNARPTWNLATDRLILGRMQAGDSVEKELRLRGVSSADEIESMSIAHEGLDAELIDAQLVNRELLVTVRLKATGGATGLIKTPLAITAKGFEHKADIIVRVEGVK